VYGVSHENVISACKNIKAHRHTSRLSYPRILHCHHINTSPRPPVPANHRPRTLPPHLVHHGGNWPRHRKSVGLDSALHPVQRRKVPNQKCISLILSLVRVLMYKISSSSAITSIDKYRLFRTTHRSGIATFTIHVHGGEDDEVAVREYIGRCITDWDKDVKWEYYVDFHT
jgi:hypothetical protein